MCRFLVPEQVANTLKTVLRKGKRIFLFNPYPTAFPYGNGRFRAIIIHKVENLERTPAQTPAVLYRILGRNRFFTNLTTSFCSATDQIVRAKWADKPSS